MFHFVVNPVSRSGKGLKIWKKKIEPVLRRNGVAHTVSFSEKRGDVSGICRELSEKSAAEENCVIVVLGGDGTLNDALQGIVDFERTTLAYIPTGSSNDFARDMKIPKSVKKSLRRILSLENPILIDVGEVSTASRVRRFAVSAGLGFDAAVCCGATHSRVKKTLNKFGLGKLTYLAIAIGQAFGAPKSDCIVELDDGRKIKMNGFFFAASMVHRFEGGGFKFCPSADCSDGTMNMCAVHGKSPLGILIALPFAFFGLHGIFRGIDLLEFKTARLTTSVPLWLHTDGEVWQKASEISVRTFPQKLRIIL